MDGLKLFSKELVLPDHASGYIYLFAPVLALALALMGWGVIPYGEGLVVSDMGLGILYLFGISSVSVYAVLMGGWSSNSTYAFLGGVRGAAQMISYEVAIGLIIISVILCAGSLNMTGIVVSQRVIWYVVGL